MKEMGKKLLNDDVWATYDVIIGTHSSTGGDYPLPVSLTLHLICESSNIKNATGRFF